MKMIYVSLLATVIWGGGFYAASKNWGATVDASIKVFFIYAIVISITYWIAKNFNKLTN